MSEFERAGRYKLVTFEIENQSGTKKADIKNVIHTFTVIESMDANSVRGSAQIYDTTGLLYNFPLVGEERIRIVTKDFYGFEREDLMISYAITDMRPPSENNDDILEFTLHFVSRDAFSSTKRFVKKSMSGLVSTMAASIFDEFYSAADKEFRIETTTGHQNIIVPNMRPDDALNFLSRRAYSDVDQSSYIRFFENRDRFNFISPGFNFREHPRDSLTYRYVSHPDNTPEGQLSLMTQLISIDYGIAADTAGALVNGKYNSDVLELDILNKRFKHNQFKYLDEYDRYSNPGGDAVKTRNTKKYMEEMSTDNSTTVILRDYGDTDLSPFPQLKAETYNSKSYAHKLAYDYHYRANMISCSIHGRNDLVAGDYIILDLYKFMKVSNSVEKDDVWSGHYVINSIENVYHENLYTQNLTITKAGVLGVPEAANTTSYVIDNRNPDLGTLDLDSWSVSL